MQLYTYTEARQKFADVLDRSFTDEVIVRRRDGSEFKITPVVSKRKSEKDRSPFEGIKGIKTDLTMDEIMDIIHESRAHAK
jgi:hypothetical protein